MRVAAMAGLLLAACGASEPEPPKELPVFQMRGLTPGSTLEDAKAQSIVEDCTDLTDSVACNLTDNTVAGAWAKDTFVNFDKKTGFRSVNADFDPEDFETVSANLREAFDIPCDVKSSTLQNAFGAKYEDYTYVWCFAGGHLTLRKYAGKIDTMELWYMPPEPVDPAETKPMTPNEL